MKNVVLIILTLLTLSPSIVFAAPDIGMGNASAIAVTAGYDTATEFSMSQTIGRYIRVAMSLVGMIFLVLTVYAGFLWMTASGNEEQVTKAKEIVERSVLGLVIVLAAYSITTFVLVSIGASTNGPAATGGAGAPAPACSSGFWSCSVDGFFSQMQKNPWGQ